MKVLLPSFTTHTITTEPRFFPTLALDMELKNEATGVITNVVPSYVTAFGVTKFTFDLTGAESDRYSVKITQGSEVVYRCKLFFTEQTPQDYKVTKGLYNYA